MSKPVDPCILYLGYLFYSQISQLLRIAMENDNAIKKDVDISNFLTLVLKESRL